MQGDGKVGGELVADPRIAGVAFTGSTEVARLINRTLAAQGRPDRAADRRDRRAQRHVRRHHRAEGAGGRRRARSRPSTPPASAARQLRILFLPHDTADEVLETLLGAMDALVIGDPADPRTDIGPIIDAEAQSQSRQAHGAHAQGSDAC